MTQHEQVAHALRLELAETLTAGGDLRSAAWRAAVVDVPRHEFVDDFFTATDAADGSPTVYAPSSQLDADEFLRTTYSNETLVTQLDGRLTPNDAQGPIPGIPTSSSTMPGLVVRMWEDLEVRDGDRVLEVGTGTGYSTALGCHRLGEDHITSIEVDPAVAARAKASLGRVGYHPRLVIGDGLAGWAEYAPYDRIIATCAVRNIPFAWVEQCRPGGVILVTLSGWLDPTGLAKLTVTDAGRAEGAFIDPDVGFMPARAEAAEFLMIPKLSDDLPGRPTRFGPDVLADPGPLRRVVQLAVPSGQYAQFGPGQDLPEHLFVESDDSYVYFRSTPSGWSVHQGGRRPLWDEAERAIECWLAAGSPALDSFRISATSSGATISFDNKREWLLPSSGL